MENFFTLDGLPHHELGMYYKVALPAGSPLLDRCVEHRGVEGEMPLVFRWVPLDGVATSRIHPVFLRAALQALPATTAHIVNRDRRDGDSAAL